MSKKSEVRNRIRKVMADIGSKDQAEFSKVLGLQPSTVSAWMTGGSLPSPAAYMTLGETAPNVEDSLFFWEQAGVKKDAILSAIRRLVGHGLAPAAEREIVGIHRYRQGSEKDSQSVFILPSVMVPNPDSTYFLRLEQESYWFVAGDILVLDTASADSPYLKAFFGRVVAVGPADAQHDPLVGRLYLQVSENGKAAARLTSVGGLAVGSTALTIAEYQAPPSTGGQGVHDEASEKMLQNPNIPVLGRVIAYLPGEGRWDL